MSTTKFDFSRVAAQFRLIPNQVANKLLIPQSKAMSDVVRLRRGVRFTDEQKLKATTLKDEGVGNRTIAKQLNVSYNTVASYFKRLVKTRARSKLRIRKPKTRRDGSITNEKAKDGDRTTQQKSDAEKIKELETKNAELEAELETLRAENSELANELRVAQAQIHAFHTSADADSVDPVHNNGDIVDDEVEDIPSPPFELIIPQKKTVSTKAALKMF